MLKRLWNSNFIARHISMTHEDPKIFIRSQWQRSAETNVYYLFVRLCFVVFFLTTWLISVIDAEHIDCPESYRAKWLIYLTNWGYTVCTLQALLSVVMLISTLLTESKKGGNARDRLTLKTYKVYWTVNVIATDVAFGITIIFWSLIYQGGDGSPEAMNLIVHAFNSIAMLLDLWIVAHPVRLLHCGWTILFGLCYVIFSAIYYLAGGTAKTGTTAIYTILDWDSPGTTTIVCLGVMVFLIILHIFTYGIYRLRDFLRRKLKLHRPNKKDVDVKANRMSQTSNGDGDGGGGDGGGDGVEIKGYINEGMTQETA